MKERFSISIDDDSIKAISSLSAKTGLTKSYIVGKYIKEGLKSDMRLSHSERYFYAKSIIHDKIGIIFNAVGLQNKNHDIKNSIILLSTLPMDIFATKHEYREFKLSMICILEDIRRVNRELFEDISNCLKKLNVTFTVSSEVSEDIKPSETSESSDRAGVYPIIIECDFVGDTQNR